jgi:glycosyltransferase involved in cell wall biosynthesis
MTVGEAIQGSLLLEVPVPFRISDGQVFMELQAYQGLIRWLENFQYVSVCAPVKAAHLISPSITWAPLAELLAQGRLAVHLLPWGYAPLDHFKNVRSVRQKFRQWIPKHRYLCFSNLGVFGAWGRIAAEEAYKLRRPYAVWLDWVLHDMPVKEERNPLKALLRKAEHALLKWSSFRDLRRSGLGLFHGLSVYESYAPLVRVPRLVHDIHLSEKDVLGEEALAVKLARPPGKVSVLYVGRVHPMKGPLLWIECIEGLMSQAVPPIQVEASWIGDGPMLAEARDLVRQRGLEGRVFFPGAETDRNKILEIFRAADLFVFCHLSPESPRCLIEALMSGLPILGFDSAYVRDLLSDGGGATVPVGDTGALTNLIIKYAGDEKTRSEVSKSALRAGRRFSEESVFRHRAELIKEFL